MDALNLKERERLRHDWGEPTRCNAGPINEIREKRRVQNVSDFSKKALSIYGHIVSRFPGFQVYACGSQVRGDFVSGGYGVDFGHINLARILAGMKFTNCSDFDFWVEPSAVQVGTLLMGCDRCRLRIPENEKILLPMWDFSKLPIEAHEHVIALFNRGDWRELSKVHDQYELSPYSYCCDETGLKNYFKHGIKTGQIKTAIPKKHTA